jgi:hypothetical protein
MAARVRDFDLRDKAVAILGTSVRVEFHASIFLGAALYSRTLAAGRIARRPGTRALRIAQHGAHEPQIRFGFIE